MDIKKHIRPFVLGKGLASIPDEVLSEIFEHEMRGYEIDVTSAKERLSLVADDSDAKFSILPDFGPASNVMIRCLTWERSKSVGLSICLTFGDADYGLDHELALLAEVIPHSSRWEHLNVFLHLKEVSVGDREKILQSSIFSNLHLPSLQSLNLHCNLSRDEGDVLANDHIKHFYQSWDMPNLRSFGTSIIPKPFIAPKLSSVQLWRYYLTGSPTSGERLRDFLIAYPDLEELDIALSMGNGYAFQRTSAIVMPSLRRLRFSAHTCVRFDIRSFMGALQAPVLRKVEIEMFARYSKIDHDTAWDDLFPNEDYPALEDLTLKILADSNTKLRVPFKKLRGLRSLSLDTPSLVPYFLCMDEDKLIPALRILVLANDGNDHFRMLRKLQASLSKHNLWHCFKQLEVSSALNVRQINTLYGEEDKSIVYTENYDNNAVLDLDPDSDSDSNSDLDLNSDLDSGR